MLIVNLESPYAGNIELNTIYARACLKDAIFKGEAPMASHLLYPQVLDEDIPEEQKLGIECGLAWLDVAAYVVVYTDLGISKGMKEAIRRAEAENITVIFRTLLPDDLSEVKMEYENAKQRRSQPLASDILGGSPDPEQSFTDGWDSSGSPATGSEGSGE